MVQYQNMFIEVEQRLPPTRNLIMHEATLSYLFAVCLPIFTSSLLCYEFESFAHSLRLCCVYGEIIILVHLPQ